MNKFNDNNMDKYTLMKCDTSKPCMICGENTNFLDYCCEARVCSINCYDKLTELISAY